MNRICIATLMTVMICCSGCGPEAKKPTAREALDATEKLLSAWAKDIQGPKADYIRRLIREGADVNSKDDDGMTPLMLAASESKTPEVVSLLIEAGADVNAKDDDGMTPLTFAIWKSRTPEVVTLLIEAGADVNARDNLGMTPLMLAASVSKTPEIVTLLIEAGADVNAKGNNGRTPLSWATNPEIIKLLKEVEATYKLLSACSKGHWPNYPKADYIRVLIDEGANVNATDDNGDTPLLYAAGSSPPEIVTLLIKAGADVNFRDREGLTPLTFADNPEIINLLKDAGARE